MKKVLSLLMLLVMTFAFLPNAVAEDNSDISIGYIAANLTNQGWLIMNSTVEKTAAEKGVTLRTMTAKMNDTSTWLACFEDLVNMEVDAILFGAADATLISAIEEAVANGILCIEMDSPSGAKGTAVICIDNYSAAAQGARWIGEKLGGEGTVLLINGDATYTSGFERRNGYFETLTKEYPNMKVEEVWSEGWTDENAMNGAQDMLIALNNEVDVIACAWDGATVVISSLLETNGLTNDIMLVGFDGAGDALSLMRAGKVAMDVAQPFADLARTAVETAIKVVRGEAVETVVLDATLVTPENCEEYIVTGGMEPYVK